MTTSSKVEIYVSKRPHLKQALSQGVLNYSALARKICEEKDVESVEAVKAALSRLEDHYQDVEEERRKDVEKVLSETTVKLQDNVRTIKAVDDSWDVVVKAETESGFTHVLDGGDQSLVTLVSPERLEDVPGVLEFILSSLASEGINIHHFISCRQDTHLVIDQEDAPKVLELLQERLSSS